MSIAGVRRVGRAVLRPRRAWTAMRQRREVARLAGPKLLRALAAARPEAFFIQVGANDGQMMDPIRQTVENSHWRGLLLEPVPDLYRRLCESYSHMRGRITPVNVALAAEAGQLPFYHLAPSAGLSELPDWAQGLGSFRKDVILKHADRIPDIEAYLRCIKVPCMTWRDLCEAHDVEQVDLVLTDTEGYDYEIIRQIDFQRQLPTLVIYEHHHFDARTRQAAIELLNAHGYRLFEEGLDTWALQVRQPLPACRSLVEQWQGWVDGSPYAREVGNPAT